MKKLIIWLMMCLFGVMIFLKDGNIKYFPTGDGLLYTKNTLVIFQLNGDNPEVIGIIPANIIEDVRMILEKKTQI